MATEAHSDNPKIVTVRHPTDKSRWVFAEVSAVSKAGLSVIVETADSTRWKFRVRDGTLESVEGTPDDAARLLVGGWYIDADDLIKFKAKAQPQRVVTLVRNGGSGQLAAVQALSETTIVCVVDNVRLAFNRDTGVLTLGPIEFVLQGWRIEVQDLKRFSATKEAEDAVPSPASPSQVTIVSSEGTRLTGIVVAINRIDGYSTNVHVRTADETFWVFDLASGSPLRVEPAGFYSSRWHLAPEDVARLKAEAKDTAGAAAGAAERAASTDQWDGAITRVRKAASSAMVNSSRPIVGSDMITEVEADLRAELDAAYKAGVAAAAKPESEHAVRRALCDVLGRLGDDDAVAWMNGTPPRDLVMQIVNHVRWTESHAVEGALDTVRKQVEYALRLFRNGDSHGCERALLGLVDAIVKREKPPAKPAPVKPAAPERPAPLTYHITLDQEIRAQLDAMQKQVDDAVAKANDSTSARATVFAHLCLQAWSQQRSLAFGDANATCDALVKANAIDAAARIVEAQHGIDDPVCDGTCEVGCDGPVGVVPAEVHIHGGAPATGEAVAEAFCSAMRDMARRG